MDIAAFCQKTETISRKKEQIFACSTFGGHPNKGATEPRSLVENYLHDQSKHFIIYEILSASAKKGIIRRFRECEGLKHIPDYQCLNIVSKKTFLTLNGCKI
jgi:hypothetical protein